MASLSAPISHPERNEVKPKGLSVIPDLIGNPSLSSLTTGFRAWLHAKNYSDSTVRNYLVDINKYLTFIQTLPLHSSREGSGVGFAFDDSTLSSYISQISADLNASRTLASLSLFCQYAVDQNIISANPVRKLINRTHQSQPASSSNLDSLLESFKIFLFKHHKTAHTVTNYIADIKQFINFCQNTQSTLSQSPLSKGDIEGLKTIT